MSEAWEDEAMEKWRQWQPPTAEDFQREIQHLKERRRAEQEDRALIQEELGIECEDRENAFWRETREADEANCQDMTEEEEEELREMMDEARDHGLPEEE